MFKKIIVLFIFIFSLFSFSSFVYAGIGVAPPPQSEAIVLPNPLGHHNSINEIIARVISIVLGMVGSIAMILFVYGGFLWMTAAGNQERVTKGKQIFMWAIIGLAAIFTAGALVQLVFKGLGVS